LHREANYASPSGNLNKFLPPRFIYTAGVIPNAPKAAGSPRENIFVTVIIFGFPLIDKKRYSNARVLPLKQSICQDNKGKKYIV
jgi:hypothetical protein